MDDEKKDGHSKKPRIKPLSKLQSDALKIFNTCMEEGKIFKSQELGYYDPRYTSPWGRWVL